MYPLYRYIVIAKQHWLEHTTVYNGKSRHISLRHGYVRELIQRGVISISYVRTSEKLADPFTKPLMRDLVATSSWGIGLKLPKEIHDWR